MVEQGGQRAPAAAARRYLVGVIAYMRIAGLLGLLLYPVGGWLVRSWLVNPYYTHGFLIPVFAAVVAWRQWRRVKEEPRRGETWAGMGLAGVSLAVVLWAMRWQDYAVVALAIVPLLAGILLYLEGWPRLKPWLFPLLFLTLMVPLPAVDRLSPWMASFTARWAVGLARLVGVAAVQQGGEITLGGGSIVVGAPCSGLRSMVAITTLGIAWIYIVEGRWMAKLALLASLLPLVATANVVRIAGLLAVATLFGHDVALTYYHDWSGLLLFLLAVGSMLGLGKVLGCAQVRDDIW
jgi:exosortase